MSCLPNYLGALLPHQTRQTASATKKVEQEGSPNLYGLLWDANLLCVSAHDYDIVISMGMCGLRFCLSDAHDEAAQSLHSCVMPQLCLWDANLLCLRAHDHDVIIPMDICGLHFCL